ncbi:MAG: GspH/FimT family pseudopilin [Candidatus Omnitrophica bacterium]|nr:GspH/FimT family pseudopilin [Candidatus Omnitrophota bacterium]
MSIPIAKIEASRTGQGFTLVEVILVAVVLGLLLTAAVPRFQQTAQRLQTEQAAFSLAQLLRYAHERAVIQGRAAVWVWNVEERRARVAQLEDDGQRQWLTEHVARSRPIHNDIAVTLAREGAEVDAVTFFPDGTSDAATLRVVHHPFSYTITVDAATSQPVLSTTAP